METDHLYLQTALKAGQIVLSNGSETARCEKIMRNILARSGQTDYDSSIVSTSIFARLGEQVGMITIKKWSPDLNKVCLTNSVSRNLANGTLSIEEASEKLNDITRTKLYGFFIRLLAYVLLMAAMPLLIEGTLYDCIAAAFCGVILALVDAGFQHIYLHSFPNILIKAILMVFCAVLTLMVFPNKVNINIVLIASITPLLPGLAMTNAVRDTLQGDYVSGAGRLMEAMVKAVALSLGVTVGLSGISLIPALAEALSSPGEWLPLEGVSKYAVYAAAALVFSAGFCVIIEVPVRFAIAGSVIGCLGKVLCLFLAEKDESIVFPTFVATILIAVLAHVCAKWLKAPTITFLISGIMALVPGSALYKSALNIVLNDYKEGAFKLLDTLMIAGAIAVAIFLVDTVFGIASRVRKKELFH